MGGEGKLNTRRGMGSSAAGRIQHSQDIFWQARKKAPRLVRPQRPGATDSYEQKRPSPPESVAKQGALDPSLQHTKMHADCYKNAPLQRAADRNDMKGFYNGLKEVCGPKKKGPVHLKSTDGRLSLTAR